MSLSIGPSSFSPAAMQLLQSITQTLSSELSQVTGGAQALRTGDSFGGTASTSGSGAAAGGLPSPTASGLADRLNAASGSGGVARPAGVSPELWNAAVNQASGGGATGGTSAVSGAGATPTTGGGSNLADAAKAQNWQYLDDRQKANLALQEAAQKQSEAAALITTLMKMLHDTLTQIIQNMK